MATVPEDVAKEIESARETQAGAAGVIHKGSLKKNPFKPFCGESQRKISRNKMVSHADGNISNNSRRL